MANFTTKHIAALFIIGVLLSGWYKYQSSMGSSSNYKNISYYQKYSLNKPDSVSFCNERVPLEEKSVQEKLDKAMFKMSYLRRKTGVILRRVDIWFPRLEKILEQNNIPDDFKYMAVIESNLNSEARSPRGAVGFWQFIPSTAEAMGLTISENQDERKDPIKSTKAACKYLKKSYRQLNNWTNVAASYNMGVSGMQRQLHAQRKNSYFDLKLNKETGQYVYKIIALKEILENRSKYGHEKKNPLVAFLNDDLLSFYL